MGPWCWRARAVSLMMTVLLLAAPAVAEPEPAEAKEAASGEPSAAPAAAGEVEPVGEASELAAKIASLKDGAASRLDASLKSKLGEMSSEQIEALMTAPEGAQLSDDDKAIRSAFADEAFERELHYRDGDIPLGDGLATLHLGKGFRYLDPDDAEKLLVQGWGNPPSQKTLGMIVPNDVSPLADQGWGVVVTYTEDGYVDDDDADDIDYDDLLEEMQVDTKAGNEQRLAQGYGSIELLGWAAPPHYDAETHRLYWAKELKFSDAPDNTLNYAIRVLGRKGVLELNAVANMSQLGFVRKEMEKVLPKAEFGVGSRYSDFNPDIDEVAAYGIGGLIAGKVLIKAGFFAGLLKLLIAAKKLILVGVVAVGAALAKLLRGRSSGGQPEA